MSKQQPAFYFMHQLGLSRHDCTWMRQYFELTQTSVASVTVYENGVTHTCAVHPTIVLPGVVPCSRADYLAAKHQHTRYRLQRVREERAKKDALKLLRGGMQRHEHASREAGATVTGPELVAVVAAPAAPVLAVDVLADYTVFDCETTGFSPDHDHLLELAATRFTNGKPVDSMQSFVHFTGYINPRITQLTGIQLSHTAKAPEVKKVLQEFFRVAGDSLLVGHNVGFDLRFVNAARKRLGAPAPLPNAFLCTQVLAKSRLPKLASHKLGDLCRHFNISAVKAHRAGADVLMTAKLLQLLHAQQPIDRALVNATSAPKPVAATGPDLFALAS